MKYIIFPDIHGRDFWKTTVEAYKDFEDITYIFLGDYLDPYQYEDIPMQKAIDNFKEILDFQINDSHNVVLLLGNHDLHYISNEMGAGSRFDYFRAEEIRKIFEDAIAGQNVLQMTYDVVIDGKRFYFSHAGVSDLWISNNKEYLYQEWELDNNPDPNKNGYSDLPNFNYLFESKTMRDKFFKSLGDVSFHRWGPKNAGSIVWADWQEFIYDDSHIPGIIQVFGHSQQEHYPISINDEFFCLDVRRPFILNEDGKLTELDGTAIPQIDIDNFIEEEKKRIEKLMMFAF